MSPREPPKQENFEQTFEMNAQQNAKNQVENMFKEANFFNQNGGGGEGVNPYGAS